jgi:hypothetical protein
VPVPGTAYTVSGPCTGLAADERIVRSYPMEAHCLCGEMIGLAAQGARWVHTGRKPGEPLG